jgi:hypothetical protein
MQRIGVFIQERRPKAAYPPSPTRGEGRKRASLTVFCRDADTLWFSSGSIDFPSEVLELPG